MAFYVFCGWLNIFSFSFSLNIWTENNMVNYGNTWFFLFAAIGFVFF